MKNEAEALARDARTLLGSYPEAAGFLKDWGTARATRDPVPQAIPALRWLAELPAKAEPVTVDLVRALVACADKLAWGQTYSAEDFGAAFLDRYGWSELIGLRGPIASETLACGFLMLGPEVSYPPHAHEAEEIYLPLSGTASWRRGDEPWRLRPPGLCIRHPAWMPHAMRTASEPLLALYLWRGGDLAAKSRISAGSARTPAGGLTCGSAR